MVTRARFTADLVSTINANTSSPANAVFISSGGDVTIANSITVGGNIPGFVQNTYLHATFAQNAAIASTFANKIQVGNADVSFVTKSTALASNNALIGLINDRLQVANADTTFVTKAVALASNTALVSLINDRLQVANLTSKLAPYWPSANAIAYINTNAGSGDMTVNTSIFVASGGETSVEIPVTSNNNLLQVHLNGFALTRSIDWTANSTHIKNIEALAAGDIVQIHEYKVTPANTLNRSSGGGGGGGHVFGGTTSGYHSGGTPFGTSSNVIEKWPFSSDTNSSDVGDMTCGRRQLSGQSSDASGYNSGGFGATPPFAVKQNIIDKFPFASDGNATDVGDMTVGRHNPSGHSSDSSGYITGGFGTPYSCNIIEKFPFASDSNASDIGDLATETTAAAGQSSATDGFVSGGRQFGPVTLNCIQKFSFSSDGNATDHADLVFDTAFAGGQSSATHGYLTGGGSDTSSPTGNPSNADQRCMIQKFSFSSGDQATDIGELTAKRYNIAGVSSTTFGYSAGGRDNDCSNVIDKFPFSSDTNATDVGNLLAEVATGAGQQV